MLWFYSYKKGVKQEMRGVADLTIGIARAWCQLRLSPCDSCCPAPVAGLAAKTKHCLATGAQWRTRVWEGEETQNLPHELRGRKSTSLSYGTSWSEHSTSPLLTCHVLPVSYLLKGSLWSENEPIPTSIPKKLPSPAYSAGLTVDTATSIPKQRSTWLPFKHHLAWHVLSFHWPFHLW